MTTKSIKRVKDSNRKKDLVIKQENILLYSLTIGGMKIITIVINTTEKNITS
jgi:hypothetical protein